MYHASAIILRKNKTTPDTDSERSISCYTRGYSATEIAKINQVKQANIYENIKKYQCTNEIPTPKRVINRLFKMPDIQKNAIK